MRTVVVIYLSQRGEHFKRLVFEFFICREVKRLLEAGELNKARNFLINDLLNNSSSREKVFLQTWSANVKEVVK